MTPFRPAPDGPPHPVAPKTVALILGAAVSSDGTPSPPFDLRIRRAVDLWRTGRVSAICTTGGRGRFGPPEGQVARNVALAFGLHRPGRWGWALAVTALALAIREHVLPFVLLLAAMAGIRLGGPEAGLEHVALSDQLGHLLLHVRDGARPQCLDHKVCQTQNELRLHHEPGQDLVPCMGVGLGAGSVIVAQLDIPQPRLSRELAKLRDERILAARREGKVVHYSLIDDRAHALVDAICHVMLGPQADETMRIQTQANEEAAK